MENASDADSDIAVELIQSMVKLATEKLEEAQKYYEIYKVAYKKYRADEPGTMV
jgi:hypothetical protein